ncbi:MAG TPA: substrate-binding domain-containing protein [Streptosporangiaceae bacterium]|nr:substrate-binding domain-containing protein [Streptosporangiaceae bacterium]
MTGGAARTAGMPGAAGVTPPRVTPAGMSPARMSPAGRRLRLARQARGYSQQQLAGMAGVSRQALSAVESGHSDPSLRAALALARALGMTVEELFGPGDPAPAVQAVPVAPAGGAGSRAVLAPVGDGFVALPLAADTATRAGFLPAGGLVAGAAAGTGGRVPVQPIGPPRPTLVVAGCDPALPLLEAPLSLLDPPVGFAWWPCGSAEALSLAARGLVHVAGVHEAGRRETAHEAGAREAEEREAQEREAQAGEAGRPGGSGRALREHGEVIGFASWREGLVLRGDLARSVAGLGDIARQRLRLVNREPGSEARYLLDRERLRLGIDARELPGYETCVRGHLQVASSVAAGLADAGVASEPAALAYGLAFVPLAWERFDLVIPAAHRGSREVQGLVRVLASPWLLAQLASLPGYATAECGDEAPAPGRSPAETAAPGRPGAGPPRPDER